MAIYLFSSSSLNKFFFRNFTEVHLAQIKTVVPEFFRFSLVKSPREKSSYELVITPVYGS